MVAPGVTYELLADDLVGSPLLSDLGAVGFKLNDEERGAPGMVSPEERRLLVTLMQQRYRGAGAVIDGGSFFGSSLVAAASGLKRNPGFDQMSFGHLPGGKPIHAYELGFLPAPKSDKIDPHRVFSGIPYKLGDSFVHVLEEAAAPHTDVVQLHIGDLNKERWNGAPIELAFIDVCKTMALNAHVSRTFYASLIGGASYLINQDFFFDRLPWIKVSMAYFADHLQWEGQIATSSVYSVTRDIPQDMAEYDPFTMGGYEECLALHDKFDFPHLARKRRCHLALSRAYLMALKDRKDDAMDTLAAFHAEYEDLMDGDAKTNKYVMRYERAERQIRTGLIKRIS